MASSISRASVEFKLRLQGDHLALGKQNAIVLRASGGQQK